MKKILTISEAAHYLRISKSLLYQLVERQEIKHIRINRRILFDAELLDQYIENHTVAVGVG